MTQRTDTCAERLARALARHSRIAFGVMGNGNAHVIDALLRTECRYLATRHEAGAVGAADGFWRATGSLAVATVTYGPGYTNALTPLAEAAQARTPMLVVIGAAPSTGPRPWDVDQPALAEALGVPTVTLSADGIEATVAEASRRSLSERRPVVIALPYDVATSPANGPSSAEDPATPTAREVTPPAAAAVAAAAAALSAAERPLIVAGRGAISAGAAPALRALADRLGAPTATTVLARDVFRGSPWDLGIAGGFATVAATELISAADVVLVVGAGLNPFTSRFGAVFGPEAHVIRVDIEPGPTQVPVGQTLVGDARDLAEALLAALGPTPSGLGNAWRSTALAGDGREARLRDPGAELAEDGRLDPRSLVTELDRRLPATRSLVQDIGHSIGWAPMYLSLPAGAPTVFMGTAFQSIGLGVLGAIGVAQAGAAAGTVVLGTGDGSALMALADLDTLARTAPSCVVVVYNDGAYGAEVHQYATQGLDPGPMLLREADFAQLARGVGGSGAVIRRHADLAALDEWVAAGASGLFVLDCRVSATLVAPFMEEIAAHVRAHDEKRSPPERGQNYARLG